MKKITLIALIVIVLCGLLFFLFNNYIYSEKQADNDLETSKVELRLEGSVLSTDVEAMMVDGPALIKVLSNQGEEYDIAIASMGRNLCVAATAIADPGLIKVGDLVKVSGAVSEDNVVIPCEKEDHYLEIYEKVIVSEADVSFNYRKEPNGYILDSSSVAADNNLVYDYSLTHVSDLGDPVVPEVPGEAPPTIQLRVYNNPEKLAIENWIKQNPALSNITLALTDLTETEVGGRAAYKYQADGLYATDYYIVGHGTYILVFTAAYSTGESPLISDLQNLLESIIFGRENNTRPIISEPIPENIKTATFVGNLDEVYTSCLADGECSVTVSGNKVVTLIGWNTEVVGSVLGIDGFANLNDHLGARVEVYAQELNDDSYTLYGSNNFYVKLLDEVGFSVKLGEIGQAFKLQLRPLSVISDSRCPSDVTCIQAGTVEIEADLATTAGSVRQNFSLNETVTTEIAEITLVRVDPVPNSETQITNSDYGFHFKVRSI